MTHLTKYRKIQFAYIAADILSAIVIWLLFLLFRWMVYEGRMFGVDTVLVPAFNFWRAMVIYPLTCIVIYYLSGYYIRPLDHQPSRELLTTFVCAAIISIGAFFIIIIDDHVTSYERYYLSLLVLFTLQFLLSWLPRLTITLLVRRYRRHNLVSTAIIGEGAEAARIAGGLGTDRKVVAMLPYTQLGSFHELKRQLDIEEVIVAVSGKEDEQRMYNVINRLYPERVEISFSATVYDMLTGAARIENLSGEPLIIVTRPSMSDWQICMKRAFDVAASVVALVVLSPLMAVIALLVKMTSKGRVIYKQERIGMYGLPFEILKFRTMVENAEQNTPMLSAEDDPRATKVGRWLRKYRLDELPQFWNILRGDMSIVGPRPERPYYIEKITERAPYYCMLYKIRPGLTSWGPIRVGYTDTIDKMIQRLNYDIVYVENMSLRLDVKIMIYTIKVLLDGRGR